jgi:quinol monooxygenase YgiN
MLVNAVTYTFPAERADEIERLLRELGDASRREPGCAGFDVCRGDDESPGTFVLFEKWRSQAALDAHYTTEHFTRLGANGIRPLATSRQAVKGTLIE